MSGAKSMVEELLDRALHAEAVCEHNANLACAWAWDTGANRRVDCYWCGLNLGKDEGFIRSHTAGCEKRPLPTHERERLKAAVLAFARNKMHAPWLLELGELFEAPHD